MKLAILAALFLVSLGCAHRGPMVTNYYVGPTCHVTARLIACDQEEPPHCQKVVVRFTRGCEVIDLKQKPSEEQ